VALQWGQRCDYRNPVDTPEKETTMNSPDKDQLTAYQEVRKTLVERLKRLQVAPVLLEDMSVFQLVNLVFLMAGFLNYTGTFTCTAWTLEELLGKDAFFDKPSEQRAQSTKIEATPKEVVN
jgi:hypothetical protein